MGGVVFAQLCGTNVGGMELEFKDALGQIWQRNTLK
jgi:hypothetical protein